MAGAVVVLGLMGCGGGGGDATAGSTPSLSWAVFLKKATPICERGTDKIDVLYSKAAEHVPKDDKNEHFMNEAAARIVIPIRREELRKIRALGLPAGHEKKIEAFLAALQEGIETGERSHPALRGSDGEEYSFEKAYLIAGHGPLGACFRG
ncbi:MAG TPA: hypothetical protein VG448_06385 [Solirubrobacterales bacterium]|nr:hypothetical protein [Solirubrobacterales bacterium]